MTGTPPVDRQAAVALTGVEFAYGPVAVFRGFDLAVAPGDFLGVIGPNGAGKSTLLKLAAGLLRPARGRVRIAGEDVDGLSRREIARRLSVVPQESHFAFDYSVSDVVMTGRNPYLGRMERPGAADRERVERALEFVGASGLGGKGINGISGGEKQLVVLARALVQETGILLLDEPTAHLDIAHQQRFSRLLRRLNREGKTVVLLSHDLNLASLLCSRVLLLDRGRVACCDVPEKVITREAIARVYGVEPIVERHPGTGRPQVMLPGEER